MPLVAACLGLAGSARAQEPDLPILRRGEWNAKAPAGRMAAHSPSRITIHHSATRAGTRTGLGTKLRNLQSFSQRSDRLSDGRTKPAWPDVPYHYYIDAKGAVAEGREAGFVGDTNTDYDPNGHIGVVVEGNFEVEVPTEAQLAALERLLVVLARRHGIGAGAIGTHRAFARTACPGRNLEARIPQLKAAVARALARG